MRSKVLILVLAVGLGLAAAFAAGRYLDSMRSRIEAGTQPVEILVVDRDLPQGTTAEDAIRDKLIVKKRVARQYVADQAISSFATIDGQVSAVPLTRGEQVTQADFRYASEAGAAYSVPDGHLAVSVLDDPVRGVSGFVKPGDMVAVISTFEVKQGDITTAVTKIVLPRARVLGIDQNLTSVEPTTTAQPQGNALMGSTASTGQELVNTVTLAVSPKDAERLVFADDEGELRLALISRSNDSLAKTDGAVWKEISK
jgi:pilus assembly protein CpaB